MSAAWTALATGAGLGVAAYAAIATAGHRVRRAIKRQGCPLCGHQPASPPPRSFGDGAAQLIDQLDQQKEQP